MDKVDSIKGEIRSEFRSLFKNRSDLTCLELFSLYKKTFFQVYGCRSFRRKVRSILERENLRIKGRILFWAGEQIGGDVHDLYVDFHLDNRDFLRFLRSENRVGFTAIFRNRYDSWGRDLGFVKAYLADAGRGDGKGAGNDDFCRLWGLWHSEEDPKIAGKIADLMR